MNKMGLKIIALGCILLMIAGMFLPFVSVSGYTTILFDVNKELNYFPYILIAFSLISVIVILLNKKIEFAYLLIGSSLTFLLTTTIDSIEDFKYFSIGYYLITVSTVLLFLVLTLLGMKKEKIIVKKDEPVLDVKENINFENIEPNEFAKSIMDQPVMNNEIPTESKIDFSEVNNEDVVLAPQNPLNSFLPSDFNPNEIVKEENKIESVEEKISVENKVIENSSNSIMSVMSQPMVNSNLNNTQVVENNELQQSNIENNNFNIGNRTPIVESQSMNKVMPSAQQPSYQVNNQLNTLNNQVNSNSIPEIQPQINANLPYQSIQQNNN